MGKFKQSSNTAHTVYCIIKVCSTHHSWLLALMSGCLYHKWSMHKARSLGAFPQRYKRAISLALTLSAAVTDSQRSVTTIPTAQVRLRLNAFHSHILNNHLTLVCGRGVCARRQNNLGSKKPLRPWSYVWTETFVSMVTNHSGTTDPANCAHSTTVPFIHRSRGDWKDTVSKEQF